MRNTSATSDRPAGRRRTKPPSRATVTRRNTDYGYVPQVRLSGWWLTDVGFPPGSRCAIEASKGRLVVTVTAPPEPRCRFLCPRCSAPLRYPQGWTPAQPLTCDTCVPASRVLVDAES
jgi:Toxin SymE, type I toxin-antitoxin system